MHVQLIVQTLFWKKIWYFFEKSMIKRWFIQRVTNNYMLCIYLIPVSNYNSIISAQSDIINDLLPSIIPRTFWSDIMKYDNRSNNMLDYLNLGDTT